MESALIKACTDYFAGFPSRSRRPDGYSSVAENVTASRHLEGALPRMSPVQTCTCRLLAGAPLHSRRFVMAARLRTSNVRRGRDRLVEVVGVNFLLRVGWD
jgi:hypothetical protein